MALRAGSLVALIACAAPVADRPGPSPEDHWGEATTTVPAFYGHVPRNVLMVSIDTFRRDSLARYGGTGATPLLDALAAQGFAADDHLTTSNWTLAGTATTVAGAYALDLGWVPSLPTRDRSAFPDAPVLLAEALADAGWYAVLRSSNDWFAPRWGTTAGYHDVDVPDVLDDAERLAARAFDHLERARDRGDVPGPWLVHVHAIEPHAPYAPPDAYLPSDVPALDVDFGDAQDQYRANDALAGWSAADQDAYRAHLWDRYRGELTWFDDKLAAILEDARSRGLLDDTLVVVWSDHGEAMFEHGVQSHAWTLHGPENDGIWLMWAPNIVPGAWDGPTTSIDIAPSLLGLLDVPVPSSMQGLPVGAAPADRPRHAWAYARASHEVAVTKDGWKLTFRYDGVGHLYDRSTDPAERTDLWDPSDPAAHPRVAPLWDLLAPRMARAAALTGTPVRWPPGLPHP